MLVKGRSIDLDQAIRYEQDRGGACCPPRRSAYPGRNLSADANAIRTIHAAASEGFSLKRHRLLHLADSERSKYKRVM
jgi:hypothetical protein